jgi:hypothetical protein
MVNRIHRPFPRLFHETFQGIASLGNCDNIDAAPGAAQEKEIGDPNSDEEHTHAKSQETDSTARNFRGTSRFVDDCISHLCRFRAGVV